MFRFLLTLWNKALLRFHFVEYSSMFVDSKPRFEAIPKNTIVIVGNKYINKWAFMKCPCGCNEVLTLSLMKSHTPNWSTEFDKSYRITFSPSVWKKDGCHSHFFIEKGKIRWV